MVFESVYASPSRRRTSHRQKDSLLVKCSCWATINGARVIVQGVIASWAERRPPPESANADGPPGYASLDLRGLTHFGRQRKGEVKRGRLARRALGPEPPAVCLDDAFGDVEAEPQARDA